MYEDMTKEELVASLYQAEEWMTILRDQINELENKLMDANWSDPKWVKNLEDQVMYEHQWVY